MVGSPATTKAKSASTRAFGITIAVPGGLLLLAAAAWWWSVRMSHQDMSAMAFATFALAWSAMMAAMMFPAILPVVRLYGLAVAHGRAAPLPFFVSGYLIVWTAVGIPAYFASQALMMPLMDARPWAARLAGGVLVAAAVWQVTPIKNVCLRHCRTPLGFFMRLSNGVNTPLAAIRAGVLHGSICIGCCWALMAVLVALGTMNIAWMAGLAGLILVEKNAPNGEAIAHGVGAIFAALGLVLILHPASISTVI